MIRTKDSEGRINGQLYEIWNANDAPELRPDQVYLTTILPGKRKGPHLHMERRGFFACVAGEVIVVMRLEGEYSEQTLQTGDTVLVPAGMPCAFYVRRGVLGKLINMPSPAWSKEKPDEHEVKDWKDPEWWAK